MPPPSCRVGQGARHHAHHGAGPAPQADDHQWAGDRHRQRSRPQGQHQDQCDGAEGPDPGVGHDLEPPRPADGGKQAVGRVGQSVQVQAARQCRIHHDGDDSGDGGRPDPPRHPPGHADDRTHGDPDQGEPRERALVGLGGPAEHGEERQRPLHGRSPAGGSSRERPATTR